MESILNTSGLVLEGGGLRGAFTSGVLEYFIENDISFPRVIGVSAGACIGASYLSRQLGRNWKVYVECPSDKRFMGLRYLLLNGSYFNMKYLFDEIPNTLIPFDQKSFFESATLFDVVTTLKSSGKRIIFSKDDLKIFGVNNVLCASSSIPLLSKSVNIAGQQYYDGGVSDSIPVEYALSKHHSAVVILTRPRGYRKKTDSHSMVAKFAFRKYPEFLQTLLKRNEDYNRTLDYCEQMEKAGRLFVIAPSPEYSVERIERDPVKLSALYNHGHNLIQKEYVQLQSFLDMQ